MTALSRIRRTTVGVALAAALSVPALAMAQTSEAPVDVTAAPPPSSDSVGPAQLRNFSLGGTPTRPAQPTSQPPASTAPATSSPAPAASRPTPTNPPAASSASRAQPTPAPAENPLPQPAAQTPPLTTDIPEPVAQPTVSSATTLPVTTPDSSTQPASIGSNGFAAWQWIAAIAAVLAAAALFWWTRRVRRDRVSDPGRLAFAGAIQDAEEVDAAPRSVVPPAARPAPTPAPTPAPAPAPVPAQPAARSTLDGMITSSALKPALSIRLTPERLALTEREAVIQFNLMIENVGSAPARDILVEAIMITASARQDHELVEFFQKPRAEGDRIPMIAPIDRLELKSVVRLPLDSISKFEAGGRTLFVPLIAFNLLYRGGGVERQNSASFLIGRGNEGDEKLAPFRLDLGSRTYNGLAARPHSTGLNS